MKFILGKKLEMSQIFNEKGEVIPVTLVQAGPCLITQIKKQDSKDKYSAVQIGFDKKKSLSKAVKGHLKDLENFRWLREFRLEQKNELKRGDKITVETFEIGDKVKITGASKGKGFQGVVRRHSFHGSPASHGHKDQLRMPGSSGPTGPARVFKGKRMPGHMGSEQITVKNLDIIKIDKEKNILYIKGAVPGSRNSLILIQGDGELKVNVQNKKSEEIEKLRKGEIEEKE
ncbi:50S ribosomal protein L3 [Patescibacteria group bacterium]|nr:50S ribosomal protein L3 [Patescibacteria group bacterium]MBU4482338.1 50S ribosomal protein L3 [Patescibacteria group bacterium]